MTGSIVVTAASGEEPAPTATEAPTGMPSTGSGSSLDSAASQTNLLFIAAAVATALGLGRTAAATRGGTPLGS